MRVLQYENVCQNLRSVFIQMIEKMGAAGCASTYSRMEQIRLIRCVDLPNWTAIDKVCAKFLVE